MTLRIFAITKPGLVALALTVLALWTCVGWERHAEAETERDEVSSIRTLARLRRLTQPPSIQTPVRAPMPAYRQPHASAS